MILIHCDGFNVKGAHESFIQMITTQTNHKTRREHDTSI